MDPEGRKIHIASSLASRILGKVGVNTYHAKVSRDISRLKQMDSQIQTMIVVLEKSENTYTITPVSDRPDKKMVMHMIIILTPYIMTQIIQSV